MQQTYLEIRNDFRLYTEEAKKAFDETRRAAFEDLGDSLLSVVRSNIPASGVNDYNQTVQRWQDVRRGSLAVML